MNDPAVYLGLRPSTYEGVTLVLHAYVADGEDYVGYSRVGPRTSPEEPHVLLSEVQMMAPPA